MNFFTSKNSNEVIFRPPEIKDVDRLTTYVNELSAENTYLRLSGETFTREDEYKIVDNWLFNIKQGDKAMLLAFIDNKLIGCCNIDRNKEDRKRGLHVGTLGLSIKKEFREQGIGKALALATIDLAKKTLPGLRLMKLTVYEPNTKAKDLYKKLGFVQTGFIPKGLFYKGSYYDELIMVLSF